MAQITIPNIATFSSQIQELQTKLANQEESNSNALAENAKRTEAMSSRMKFLESELEQKEKEFNKIDALNTSLNAKIVNLVNFDRALEQAKQNSRNATQQDLPTLVDTIVVLNEEIVNLGSQRTRLNQENSEKEKAINDLFNKQAADEKRWMQEKSKYALRIENLQNQHNANLEQITTLQRRLEKCNDEKADLKRINVSSNVDWLINFLYSFRVLSEIKPQCAVWVNELDKINDDKQNILYFLSRTKIAPDYFDTKAMRKIISEYPRTSENDLYFLKRITSNLIKHYLNFNRERVNERELQVACKENTKKFPDLEAEQLVEQTLIDLLHNKMKDNGFESPEYPFPAAEIAVCSKIQSVPIRLIMVQYFVEDAIYRHNTARDYKNRFDSIKYVWGEIGTRLTPYFWPHMTEEQKNRATNQAKTEPVQKKDASENPLLSMSQARIVIPLNDHNFSLSSQNSNTNLQPTHALRASQNLSGDAIVTISDVALPIDPTRQL